jgi:hypothetical protein
MKNFKSHCLYFPLAMVLSLSPMVFKSIHNEIKPHVMTRSLASIEEEKSEEQLKYEKLSFEEKSKVIDGDLNKVKDQMLDVVLKKDKKFEDSLHDLLNAQFAKIEDLEKSHLEKVEDKEQKKVIEDKIAELRAKANELCDKLEKVVEGTKHEEKKEEVVVAEDDKKKEEGKEKKEDCDLQQKYAELSKQVEAMTADHKRYLDVIVGMNQMMISMYQHQQQPQYTYSSGPFGSVYYPYMSSNGLGQVTNNYYYSGSNWQQPQIMGMGQYGQQGQPQAQPQQQPQVTPQQDPTMIIPQGQGQQQPAMMMDPRYSTMNVMPGNFGDMTFMHNFGGVTQQSSPMVVDTGRAPAVVPF